MPRSGPSSELGFCYFSVKRLWFIVLLFVFVASLCFLCALLRSAGIETLLAFLLSLFMCRFLNTSAAVVYWCCCTFVRGIPLISFFRFPFVLSSSPACSQSLVSCYVLFCFVFVSTRFFSFPSAMMNPRTVMYASPFTNREPPFSVWFGSSLQCSSSWLVHRSLCS